MVTRAWDRVPVYGWYEQRPGVPATGTVRFSITQRVTRVDGRAIYPGAGLVMEAKIGDQAEQDATARAIVHDALRAQAQAAQGEDFDPIAWEAAWTESLPSAVFASFWASDDPDVTPNGWEVKVEEKTAGGKTFHFKPVLSMLDDPVPGQNLAFIDVPPGAPSAPAPIYAKGQPGGVAPLDSDGLVPAQHLPEGIGGGGVSSWNDLTDKPTTFPPTTHDHAISQVTGLQAALDGKANTGDIPAAATWDTLPGKPAVIAAGTSQTAARNAIGAGTSNLQLGTGPTTAAAGDHTHSQYATTTALNNGLAGKVDTTVLGNVTSFAYGTTLPSSAPDGAVFFLIED